MKMKPMLGDETEEEIPGASFAAQTPSSVDTILADVPTGASVDEANALRRLQHLDLE